MVTLSISEKKTQRKLDIKSSRRFPEESTDLGTCVRAYVLDTRVPVYGCVHTLPTWYVEEQQIFQAAKFWMDQRDFARTNTNEHRKFDVTGLNLTVCYTALLAYYQSVYPPPPPPMLKMKILEKTTSNTRKAIDLNRRYWRANPDPTAGLPCEFQSKFHPFYNKV